MGGVLQPAGAEAHAAATVSWVLFAGGLLIFAGVMLLLALTLRERAPVPIRARRWIAGGGIVLPATVLGALFIWSAWMSPPARPVPPPGALVVAVTAHLWWWEVRYRHPAGGADIVTANELRIPVGRPVHLALSSADVIHSFWVPQLAGKTDMLPGRWLHLPISADRPGVFRGPCAEFCGEQHARMAIHVVSLEAGEFDRWLTAQARPAREPETERQARGRQAFLAHRCDACHAVRGAGSQGRLGPDLTHLGSRLHLGAGTLANTQSERERWIADVQRIKPGARMPSYERLDPATRAAIAEWLGSLR